MAKVLTCESVFPSTDDGVFKTISSFDATGLKECRCAVSTLRSSCELRVSSLTSSSITVSVSAAQRRTGYFPSNFVKLFQDAVHIVEPFERLVNEIKTRAVEMVNGKQTVHIEFAPLKSMKRMIEKVVLAPGKGLNAHQDATGPAMPTCESICDVVRAMFVCRSMSAVAKVLLAFAEAHVVGEIKVVRVKDRFNEHAAAGGWRGELLTHTFLACGSHGR